MPPPARITKATSGRWVRSGGRSKTAIVVVVVVGLKELGVAVQKRDVPPPIGPPPPARIPKATSGSWERSGMRSRTATGVDVLVDLLMEEYLFVAVQEKDV